MESETTRTEAFSDGVFAIAITLLILEVKVPRHMPEAKLFHQSDASSRRILNMLLAVFFALLPSIMRRK